jgi:hypothetical protein
MATITASMFLPSFVQHLPEVFVLRRLSKRVGVGGTPVIHIAQRHDVSRALPRYWMPCPPGRWRRVRFRWGVYPADFSDGVLPNPSTGTAPANRLP